MIWKETIKDEMRRIQRHMDNLFRGFSRRFNAVGGHYYRDALVEMDENDNEFVLRVELPGVDKENIKLNILERGIEIKAEKKREEEKKDDKKMIYGFVRSYSGFYQSLDLSEEADLENIDALYKNGVLIIKVQKKKSAIAKKEVKIK